MRFLILHSERTISSLLNVFLWEYLRSAKWPGCDVKVVDGLHLTHQQLVYLLKEDFDCILLNLRLPHGLSPRLAELVRLAQLPTRTILICGAPIEFQPEIRLFDYYLGTPFSFRSFGCALHAAVSHNPMPARRGLPNQEHLDAAILNLFKVYNWMPWRGGYRAAFSDYRDTYLPAQLPAHAVHCGGTGRLEILARVTPLQVRDRIAGVVSTIGNQLDKRDPRMVLARCQFHRLRIALGLALSGRRDEVGSILGDLEEVSLVIRSQPFGSLGIPRSLGQSLLNKSERIPHAHRSLARIMSTVLNINETSLSQ